MFRWRRLTVAITLVLGAVTANLALGPTTSSNAVVSAGVTQRVSLVDPNTEPSFASYDSQMSADGTQVAFVSQSDLTPVVNPGCCATGVYVRNLRTGHTVEISLGATVVSNATGSYSVPSGQPNGPPGGEGSPSPGATSAYPSISADGRWVSFTTNAVNIVERDPAQFSFSIVMCDRDPDHDGVLDELQPPDAKGQVYPDYRCYKVADVQNPLGRSTEDPSEFGVDGWPHLARTSAPSDQTVTWAEGSTNSQPGSPTYVAHFRQLSDATDRTQIVTPVVATALPRTLGATTGQVTQPQISGDGRHIVAQFSQSTTALVESDLTAGIPGPLRRVDFSDSSSSAFLGSASIEVEHPAMSGDGSQLVFDAYPIGQQPFTPSAYVEKPDATAAARVSLVISKPYEGTGTGTGYFPTLSGDGRYATFVTDKPKMHEGFTGALRGGTCIRDGNSGSGTLPADSTYCQVVVRDLVADAIRANAVGNPPLLPAQLASPSLTNDCGAPGVQRCIGNFDSGFFPTLSADGGRVAYDSDAGNLIGDDTNGRTVEGTVRPTRDVFVRTWSPALLGDSLDFGTVPVGTVKTLPLTVTADGFGPQTIDRFSFSPATPDGFTINQSGCAGRVLHEGETCTVQVSFAPILATHSAAVVQVVHTTGTTQTTSDVRVGPGLGATTVAGDGTAAVDPPPITTPPIVRTSVGDPNAQAPLGGGQSQISSNGNFDVFISKTDLTSTTSPRPDSAFDNVFVRDLRTNHTVQISLAGNLDGKNVEDPITPSGSAPNGDSIQPTISGDGRIVAFVTAATNIVPTVNPGSDATTTTVVCDRDPNGDGRFDQPQSGSAVSDLRCFYVFSESQSGSLSTVPHPDLAADGNHLVYVQGTDGGDQAAIVGLSHPSGGPLVPGVSQPVPNLNPDFAGASQERPVVSDGGIAGDPTAVRVAFVATQGLTAILATDMVATPVTRRLDRVPGSATAYIGDDDMAQVDNPTITDGGAKVAFDFASTSSGVAKVYLTTVSGNKVGTQAIGVDDTVTPATAAHGADPALSGDGRYLTYITDAPYYGTASPSPGPSPSPGTSSSGSGSGGRSGTCLSYNGRNVPVQDDSCQIVARDLVVDRQRAGANLAPAPDELVTVSGRSDCGASQLTLQGRCGGDATSLNPSVDRIGDRVGFDSWANDLVQGDTNTVQSNGTFVQGLDAFVRTFLPTISTGPLTFGNVKLGSSSQQPLTLTLLGFGPYPVGTVTVGGSNGGDYSVGAGTCEVPGQILHQGETCTVSVTFTPSATGTRTGRVIVTSPRNPSDGQIPVSGRGTKKPTVIVHPVLVPQFAAAPNPVTFGKDLPLNTPGVRKNVTVRNGGTGPLVIESITVTDTSVPNARGDYTVDPNTCAAAIPAGGRCTVRITWIGRAVGERPALVRFVDNASGGFHTIGLTATVPKPTVSSAPTVSSPGRVVLVSGRGFAPRRLVDITLAAAGTGASVKADARGRVSASMVIFPNITTGPGTIIAHTHNVNATITAKVPFLVMLGSLESPRLTMRH